MPLKRRTPAWRSHATFRLADHDAALLALDACISALVLIRDSAERSDMSDALADARSFSDGALVAVELHGFTVDAQSILSEYP
jgi:hypothetical protein